MRKLKCYRGNYDGLREGLVLAYNKKEAAKIANTSIYSFNEYWQEWEYSPMTVKTLPPLALGFKPLTLYTKKFSIQNDDNWIEGRCDINNAGL